MKDEEAKEVSPIRAV